MQRQNILLISLVSLLTFCCCKGHDKIVENKVFHVDLENCNNSIDLKLSDLIDSCRLVPLETTNESMLENYFQNVFISDEFILIVDINGVYKFSADGKFIKKIINAGRGPQELSVSPILYYYERKKLLFIDDYFGHKDYIMCYDVKSETFLTSIKKCFPNRWGNFIIYNDSLIMGSLSIYLPESNPYAIFFQDFKGNFLYGIQSTRKFIPHKNPKEVLQRMFIYTGDQLIHVKYFLDDTLFTLIGNKLSPYLIACYNSARIDPPHMLLLPNIGDKQNYFERFENSSFIIFTNATYKGSIQYNYGSKAVYENVYFFLDRSNGRYGKIKSYTDDLIARIQTNENETITFPSSLPNGKLYVSYFPHELLKETSDNQERQGFSKNMYNQLNKIKSSLSETDNPVLLIGVPKKNLQILK